MTTKKETNVEIIPAGQANPQGVPTILAGEVVEPKKQKVRPSEVVIIILLVLLVLCCCFACIAAIGIINVLGLALSSLFGGAIPH